MTPKLFSFEEHKDDRGILVAIEGNKDIPFDIRRLFYIYDIPTEKSRANHLSAKSNEILIAVNGSCKIKLIGENDESVFKLSKKTQALFIPAGYWRSIFDFEQGTILLALSDTHYDPKDNT